MSIIPPQKDEAQDDDRGQSGALGYALLIGIAVIGAGAVVTLSIGAGTQTSESTQVQTAISAMDQVKSSVEMVLGGATTQEAELSATEGQLFVRDPVTITVNMNSPSGFTSGDLSVTSQTTPLAYRVDLSQRDTTIDYTGGMVARQDEPGGEVTLRQPSFRVVESRAIFSIPNITVTDSPDALGGSGSNQIQTVKATFSQTDAQSRQMAGVDATGRAAPISGTVTVQDAHAPEAWAQYFRDSDGFSNVQVSGSTVSADFTAETTIVNVVDIDLTLSQDE